MQKHIAAWELLAQFALSFCIESHLPHTRGPIACHQATDNSAADAASAKGLTMTPALAAVPASYFKFMRRYQVYPHITHIPGRLNVLADELSRFKETLSIELDPASKMTVPWMELLQTSGIVITQAGRKWPSHFDIHQRGKGLLQSADWVLPSISFPKQFTVGVLNSILKCVRLVSGAVSASGRFVFQFICLPIHLSPRSCVRGCVRLRTICLPIHLSPNSFVSQVLCQGLCLPPGDLSPNSFVRLVSGAVSASGRFVSQFICLPIHLSPRSLSPNSFVSQVLWQGLCPPPGDWFPNSFVSQFICLPGPVSGAVSASGDLSPNSFVSQFICLPGPCLPIHLSPRSCGRGCVRLRGIGFPIHLSPNSFVSQVLVSQFICLPGPVAGAVSASGGLVSQFICLPIHLSPRSCVRGCVRLRGICLPIRLSSIIPQTVYCWRSQFSFKRCPAMFRWWCLALRMSRIHLSPCGNSFVSQSGWWCPALWLSPIHLFALISTHLFPSLAGGVRLFGCLQFIPQTVHCWGTQFYLKLGYSILS